MSSGFSITDSLDRIVNELWTNESGAITEFPAMWYRIFIWAFFSSMFIHTVASLIAFATLRKHRIGRFFPVLVFLMGILGPLTTGVITSATIAFIYCASSSLAMQMFPMYAFLYGVGQTLFFILFSFTRILATL